MIEYLDSKKLLTKFQAGFRKDYRTADHVFILNQTMKYYKNKKKPLYLAFIDLRKVFDVLWQQWSFPETVQV